MANDKLYVTSHVARDLLQNAALFRTDKLVVWEYVSNGLQYVDVGTNPIVKVALDSKKKRIVIEDNGRGMDWRALQNFFVMHGENVDRQEGKPGRGRFGTGKSAAFGIADTLRITTVRKEKRSRVELRRSDIQAMNSNDPVPVHTLEKESSTEERNGTVVEIEGIHLRSLDQAGIIRYIERHLAKWPKNARVYVNNHECEYLEPPVDRELRSRPSGELGSLLGDVELVIKVSKIPLDADLRGISIFSNGVWHETTLAGSEGREMSQFIFGEVDVPRLDEDTSAIPPFDLSRSMRLNGSNRLVQGIYAFIGQSVETIRRDLQEAEKRRREGEEARRLTQQATEIARVINEDFSEFRERITRARATGGQGIDLHTSSAGGGTDDDLFVVGTEVSAVVVSPTGGPGSDGGPGGKGGEPRSLAPQVVAGAGEKRGRPAGGTGETRRPRGGFQVKFDHMGEDSHRAHYARDERAIYVNLDHPQFVAARETIETVEDVVFRRLAYEVAFAEYAVALASELASRDEYLDPSDPIVDIRDTLNRLARKAARLYAG